MDKMTQELIKKVEFEINKTPTGELRNLLCDVNIILQQQVLKTGQLDEKRILYGLYSPEDQLMFVHKTREGAKKRQYEFEKAHGMGFYVDPVIVEE